MPGRSKVRYRSFVLLLSVALTSLSSPRPLAGRAGSLTPQDQQNEHAPAAALDTRAFRSAVDATIQAAVDSASENGRRWGVSRFAFQVNYTEGMRIVARVLAKRGVVLPQPEEAGTFGDWPPAARIVRTTQDSLLLLETPGLRRDTVRVLAVLRTGVWLQLHDQRQLPAYIGDPFDRGPSDSGALWVQVSTSDGIVGWTVADSQMERGLVQVVDRPVTPTKPQDPQPSPLPVILLAGAAMLLILAWLTSAGKSPSPSAVSSSSYHGARTDTELSSPTSEHNDASSGRSSRGLPLAGPHGSTVYRRTGWFSEEEAGRIADDGTTYEKTGALSEDEQGRIDDSGNVYRKTGVFSEEQTHRVAEDGTIYKKTGWFTEEQVGRIDKDGTVYEKTGWFSEEPVGRVRKREHEDSSSCFISTACAKAVGLPDDCEELHTLRTFRDTFVASQVGGAELIREYYRLAPPLVSAIDKSGRSEAIYMALYKNLVLRSVNLIKENREEEALRTYRDCIAALVKSMASVSNSTGSQPSDQDVSSALTRRGDRLRTMKQIG